MSSQRLLILVPCFNEAQNVGPLYQEIQGVKWPNSLQVEVLFINDHSTDNTLEVLQKHNIPHLNLPINLGIGGAVQSGYRYALAKEFHYVARIDGDGQHPPHHILDLLKALSKQKAQVAIGSRFVAASAFTSTKARRAGIKVLSGWCKALSGIRVHDITSGYSLISRQALPLVAAHYPDTYPEPESVIMYGLHGFKITEVAVQMRPRLAGKSSINYSLSAFYMAKVMLGLFFITLRIKLNGKYCTL